MLWLLLLFISLWIVRVIHVYFVAESSIYAAAREGGRKQLEERYPDPDEMPEEPFAGIEPAERKTDGRGGKGDMFDDDIPF